MLIVVFALLCDNAVVYAGEASEWNYYAQNPIDSGDSDSINLVYPYEDNSVSPFNSGESPINLGDPSNINQEVQYDPVTGNYYIVSKIGDTLDYRPINYMTFEEYLDYDLDQALSKYWKDKNATESELSKDDDKSKDLIPSLNVDSKGFDNIFGGNTIDIRPSGSAQIKFGLKNSKTQNPALSERQRSITTFDFDQQIQVNLIGNIGDKMKMSINYNTEATFDFENQVKVDFTGYDDDIIQKIEAGNVSLPLSGSLITGSQSLFGLKTKLKFGRLEVTSVFSQQRGKKEEIEVKGGAQVKEYELKADEYDENRHYFISHFFRDNYEQAMSSPPFVSSPINVTRIEVWVTNNNNTTQNTRNLIAFQDLGEADPDKVFNQNGTGPLQVTSTNGFPNNQANTLYNAVNIPEVKGYDQSTPALAALGYIAQEDYQKVGLARLLTENEYTFNPQLGVISLNMEMQPNQVLSVAFQYTYQSQVYQVGEFSTDVVNSQAIFTKMLKSSKINTNAPMWDLMMKNVYSIGAYQVQKENFKFDIWYLDRRTGVPTNYIPSGPANVSGLPLIQVMNLDKMDRNMNPGPDGVFDFLSGPSNLPYINPKNGKVFFPVLEPFGSHIHNISGGDAEFIDKYAFDSLYTNTKPDARAKFPNKNRFYFKGKYESSVSNEISVGAMQIPQGSVKVTAGGRELVEGSDYQVDYNLGRVKILNQGLLESGIPIKISLESNSLFNIQTKTLLASRFDYKISKDFVVGGTIMNLSERPLTQKTSYGDEPISNTVWGVDGTYRSESQFLTRMVDNLPGIDTKEKSNFQVTGEFAQFIPGHSKAIGKSGTSYIDDFEGSQSTIDLRSRTSWSLASIPQNQPALFPEASLVNNTALGFNRALFSWYTIDPLFFRNDSRTPDHIKNDPAMQSNHFMREITVTEVFENQQVSSVQNQNIPTLDMAFYPSEKGQNNYDFDGRDSIGNVYSAGINPQDGTLLEPETRWGGIQRKIDQQNFEALNIEYIQVWVMDPFNEDYEGGNDDGTLYINLGSVSEDVQRDGQNFFENGLVSPPTDIATEPFTSAWGRYTPGNQIVDGFDNDPDARQYQDVGLDGMRDVEEGEFFSEYASNIAGIPNLENDISQDNFVYFRADAYDNQQADILTRYKKFNGYEGNSPLSTSAGAAAVGSTRPNQEDINKDKNIDETESYWQYKVKVSRADFNRNNIGNNYITDVRTAVIPTKDGRTREIDWYQLKIPIRQGEPIGGIRDFRSIRFMRVFMRGFENQAIMRFARLELVRGEWRKFEGTLEDPGDYILGDDFTNFDVSAVNIEVNSSKEPVNYVLPPFIQREINVGSTNLNQLNEQSLALNICELPDGQGRAVYRTFDLDVLSYNTIKMFVHAESYENESPVNDGDLVAFMRVGTDFENNYYEYEIPLKITLPGQYNGDDDQQRLFVWPEANNMEVSLNDFKDIKIQRNKEAIVSGGGAANFDTPYSVKKGKAKVSVVGNPSLNGVKTIMLGIRNPRKEVGDEDDDGEGKCAEIWFNELRLTDFDDQSGWASIVTANAKLADFATVSVSGSMSTPGWGSIDKKISERQRETRQDLDVQANVELGKFFGKKSGVKIPTYVGYTVGIVKPQFAPLAPDIEFEKYVKEAFPAGREQDSVRNVQQKVVTRKSLNFTNVRKERTDTKKKKKVYDISNFALNYSYNSTEMHDFETEFDNMKSYRGGISYNYSSAPKNIKPFTKSKFLNSTKWLALVKDINFYPYPKSFSFSTDVNRQYQESRTRNNNPELLNTIPVYVNKTFDWNRNYAVRWDITRAIKLDFTARNKSLIEESAGRPSDSLDIWKETVRNSIRDFGTNLNYNHAFNGTWAIPLNKIPALDWTNSTFKYGSTYSWVRAPFISDNSETGGLGNTIQNTQTMQINGTLNFVNLYNKSKYLKKVNSKRPTAKKKNDKKKTEDKKDNNDTTKTKTKKPKKDGPPSFVDGISRVLMMVRKGNASYSVTNGIMLPGYNQQTEVIGMNNNFSAPGLGFVFGQQTGFGDSDDFLDYAQRNDWLVRNPDFNNQYRETRGEKLNLKLTVEPVRDFRVELNTSWNDAKSYTTYNRYYDTLTLPDGSQVFDDFNRDSPLEQGNFSTSFNMIRTAFSKDGDDYTSAPFEQFASNRAIISERLGRESQQRGYSNGPSDSGYYDGYGPNHPDVLIPAFLAGYSGQNASSISTNVFSKMYIPNMRLTYTGLGKLPSLKKHVRNVSISSGYKSSYIIGGYTSNILFDDKGDGFTDVRDTSSLYNNFVSEYTYNSVTIREAFSPLINVDVTLKNSVQVRFEIKKDRTINLSTRSLQVMEVRGQEFTLGLGYTFKQLRAPFQPKTKRKAIKSDFKVRADFSLRKNLSITRELTTNINRNNPTNGQNTLSVKLTGDYKLNRKLTLRLFFDYRSNTPVISLSYPNSTTNGGFSIRFNLNG
ncbi:cell surface protein SprA [bacterium SCSIO 12643]|nr:cell surface protein SprA [bacterium SCSIO 12643]